MGFSELLRRLGATGRPLDASAQGWRGDELFGWITIILVVVTMIVLGHLLGVLLQRRTTPSATTGDDPRSRLLVAFSTLALTLAVDGVALWRGGRDLREGLLRTPAAGERPVEVEVLAQQWAWSFRLAGADGIFGTADDVVTLHTLRLPAGRPALFELRSKDVIHSLYVPQLRVKRDAQPGTTTHLLLEPVRAGRYEIACAQHCGANHYLMRATLDVVDEVAFDRTIAEDSAIAKERAAAWPTDSGWAWAFGASR
jgi:cytochrome c oxidase subunit 2